MWVLLLGVCVGGGGGGGGVIHDYVSFFIFVLLTGTSRSPVAVSDIRGNL